MKPTKIRTKSRRRTRGTALPAILALSVGVGALAAGFASQNLREHQREAFERNRAQAYLDAWAQMEVAAEIANNSPYDAGTGENIALRTAAARADDQFVDRDGYFAGVTCANDGPGAGYYRLTSTAQVKDARCRVTALVRARQSFADFDYFVNSHDMGISGGADASAAHRDAPDGDIHSNRRLLFYFPDRHFVKPVTAVQGFQFVSGAVGPGGAGGGVGATQNNWLWGPSNSAATAVNGLNSVDLTTFGARSDNLLNLNGTWDFAKIKLKGTQVRVEHWQYGHNEDQLVTVSTEQFHYETQQQEVLQQVATTTTTTQPVYTQQTVSVYGPVAYSRLLTAAWTETVTTIVNVPTQVWVEGGGGGAVGGGGGGAVGYWTTVMVPTPTTSTINHPATYETYYVNEWHNVTQNVQTGTQQVTTTTYTYVSYSPKRYQDVQVRISDGWTTSQVMKTVWEAQHREAIYTVGSTGTIYVTGDVELQTMTTGSDGFAVHTLDGNLSIATNGNMTVRDSIVYAKRDASNAWQTAYLNGADRTQDYIPNANYTGSSVLGLIARNDIEVLSDVPDQAELNASFMARDGEFRVRGVNVAANGTVTTSSSGSFVKMSLRRLGGIVTNQRPVTTYVDSNNAVTRGFVFTKSVYDTRQRTNPPRGFPALNRPKIMATLIREIN